MRRWISCLLLVGTMSLVGCEFKVTPPPPIKPPAAGAVVDGATTVSKPKTVEQLEAELVEAKKAEREAKQARKEKEQELADAVETERKHKLWWVGGIAILAALGCLAGAILLSNFYKPFLGGFAAFTAVAIMAFTFAAILPYLPWIIAGVITLAALTVFYFWKRDNKSLGQVVQAVETYKAQMPDYKNHFNQWIDSDVDAWLTSLRTKMGLLKAAAKK